MRIKWQLSDCKKKKKWIYLPRWISNENVARQIEVHLTLDLFCYCNENMKTGHAQQWQITPVFSIFKIKVLNFKWQTLFQNKRKSHRLQFRCSANDSLSQETDSHHSLYWKRCNESEWWIINHSSHARPDIAQFINSYIFSYSNTFPSQICVQYSVHCFYILLFYFFNLFYLSAH